MILALLSLMFTLDLNRFHPADVAAISGLPVFTSVFVANPPDTRLGLNYFGDDTGVISVAVYVPGDHDIRHGDRVTAVGVIRLAFHRPDRWFLGFVEIRVDAVRILTP